MVHVFNSNLIGLADIEVQEVITDIEGNFNSFQAGSELNRTIYRIIDLQEFDMIIGNEC